LRPISLRLKVFIYLAIILTAAMVIFTLLHVRHNRAGLLQEATSRVAQLSEVIIKSSRFAMLQNQPFYVNNIIQDVGNHESIDRVRILSKDGTITHSTHRPEIGTKVDQKAEACVSCHQSEEPLKQLPKGERARIFTNGKGARRLGSMEVIHNEPSCQIAGCHAQSKNQSVLGVLDIVYSLDEIDRSIQRDTLTIVGLSVGFVILASLGVSFFVHRMVYMPLRDLESGAKRISSGDLEKPIPVRSQDEFGQLATSFNSMTLALRNSELELREWNRTLEQKVEENTRALRVAEAEAVQREKLASVGLLAAGIAHELNNPLTAVLTFTHLTRKKMPDESPEAEDLDVVIQETKRCAGIIRRLLDFAREKTPEKKYADLNQIIEDTVHIIEQPAHIQDVEITMELDRSLPSIWVDEDLIKQVIMNMLVNAQNAIEDEGHITIRSRRSPEARRPQPDMEPVPMVELSIIDTGCGIPEENLQRIFDPFFTSKEVGKGTGLGLSVSHGIVSAHNGAIEVESTVGTGSTFRIYLPIETQPVEAAGVINER
jgi:two-component system NtrC family sensor kinase